MKEKRKNKTYYALIINHDNKDHSKLRRIINSAIPNVIIESLYDEEETISYMEKFSSRPDLIFLDMNMHILFLKYTLYMLRRVVKIAKNVPIIILNSNEIKSEKEELSIFGVSEFYLEIQNGMQLKLLAHDLKTRWFF